MTPLSQALSTTPSSRIGPLDYPVSPRRLGEDTTQESETTPVQRGEDRVELSPAAQRTLNAGQPIRADLVTRVRSEIASGTYETPEKIDLAVRRVVREIDTRA